MERERERLRCQFEKRQNLLMAGSILLILAGLFMFVCLFISMTDEEMGPVSWISCGIAGIWEVAMGIWGILIARERRVDFSRAEIIVYESKLGVGLAWALYGIGLLAAAAVFGFAMEDNGAALILAAVLALLLFGWAACWSDYRNRRILADDQRIWGTTAFGRNWDFSKSEIKEVRLKPSFGDFAAIGRNGEKLFRFEYNMRHAEELFTALEGKIPSWLGDAWREDKMEKWRQMNEIQWTPDQETEQTLHADRIRKGFRILVLVNVLLSILLFFFCPTDLLALKYQLLLIELIPLSYCIYAWVFDEVMFWLDANASKEWKRRHVGMGMAYLHGGVIMLFVTNGVLTRQVNYVTGEEKFWIGTVVLTAILWVITLFRTKKARLRKLTMGLVWFPFLVLAMGIMDASVLAVSQPVKENHYPAQIVGTRVDESDKWLDSYYVEVQLPEGETAEAEVSSSIYREINEGKPKVVCEHTGPFGMRFIAVHDP